MNFRWNLILGVIALALSAWFYSLNQEDGSLANLIKKPDSPEYIGQKMETTIFSPTGQKQYIAKSDKVEYYSEDGHTDFFNPMVFVLDDSASDKSKQNETDLHQSWKLTAAKATLTKDNMLNLSGRVVAQSLLPESRLQRIESERATVNLKTQDITSNTEVKINGQNFVSSGLKLDGNLKQQVATLKEQVKTHYEINK
ncbi:LPS export ABC transporter periplasmic protein LptC [Exercitatus varius]|uniref:LPS export ABC transporter periplasmic protein LptC n=1 Tax=Exercitatus varius TaxID=67857 RepID=UPI0018A4C06B|nr:LPS export ABC transporter periplasmic protein LptC [Exercitatus varius]QOF68892.1 LPS export ABC transporter periplasmic protein LptC [Actinobacillus sp. GY-402]MDG2944790.1 LPS export ABC transporter periplasmic protein LptC [Exercitatus varius]MDG2956650.1 LPS export ABC transporter periplasmic protein LptC [Exercitatus varius]MDG2958830.1 LPS export ABC transporter periplasmic protein LptC [Exercitatus varius]MDG2961676.1 LPS export ABC transporter periplasmic protein LptC [Exercitatus 